MAPSQTVSVVVNGKTYSGSYSVSRGMVTVSTGAGSKTTQVGGTPVEAVAKLLLHELIREGKA